MIYQLTIKHADGRKESRTAIGDIGAICDALYLDEDARGITYLVQP